MSLALRIDCVQQNFF